MSLFAPDRQVPPEDLRTRRILTWHFFERFFYNDLISSQEEVPLTATRTLGLLAVPGLFVSLFLLPKYHFYLARAPEPVRDLATWADKCMFLSFSMVIVGLVTVFAWDALFPDQRDYAILLSLPVTLRSIFVAKGIALSGFLALFLVSVNAFSIVLFPIAALPLRESLLWGGRFALTHAIGLVAAGCFIFLALVALQGVLLNVLSLRRFRQVSPYVQLTLAFALFAALVLFPKISSLLWSVAPEENPWLRAFPPMWFLGLSEALLGRSDPVFRSLARIAVVALAGVTLTAVLSYVGGYRRHARKSLETPVNPRRRPSRWLSLVQAITDRWLVRDPRQRATFYFTAQTISRSGQHRLYLAAFVGVGLSLVLEGVAAKLSQAGYDSLREPSAALLSVPLVLSFFLLVGLRAVFQIPAELAANWVFRLKEPSEKVHCLLGVRKALGLYAVTPVAVLAVLLSAALWGWTLALSHVVFCVLVTLTLREALFLQFRRIPFACAYLPASTNVVFVWVGYWLLFTFYAYTVARVEQRALQSLPSFIGLCGIVLAALAGLVLYRRLLWRQEFSLIPQETPGQSFQRLGLMP